MKLIIIEENNKRRINKVLEWLIYMLGYFIVTTLIFRKTFYINNEYFGLYSFLAAVIIYILNKTIKPILVFFTLPITGLTLGLFYPFINVFILYIVSFILGNNFQLKSGIFLPFIIAVFISLMNIMVENTVIKPILERRK